MAFSSIAGYAQDGFYDSIGLGPHEIGFADTLLFNDSVAYAQYGYNGPAPLFVDIWFPLERPTSEAPMSYRTLRNRTLPPPLQPVHEALSTAMDGSAVEYFLSEPFDGVDPIDYGTFTYAQVLDTLKKAPTRSHRATLSKQLNAPVIVYHHGSQGLSDENVVMAEYFASRGYGFVSSNFHWPIEGAMYGTSVNWTEDRSSAREVMKYARSLTASDSVFFVGHSWGAQQGWLALLEPGLAEAFVSMETTIEFKTDTNEIKDKWSSVYAALKTQGELLDIPVLLFANTKVDAPFDFFVGASTAPMWHVSAKEEFGHESYTSAFLARYLFRDRFPQPDADRMREQLALYAEHLRIIETFFTAVRSNKPPAIAPFADRFYFSGTGIIRTSDK